MASWLQRLTLVRAMMKQKIRFPMAIRYLVVGLTVLFVVNFRFTWNLRTLCNYSPLNGNQERREATHTSLQKLGARRDKDVLTILANSSCQGDGTGDISGKFESPVRPLKLVSGFGTGVILYSAIVGNSTANTMWDKLAISGWEIGDLHAQNYSCCVAFKSGTIKTFPAVKLARGGKWKMKSRQFVCSLVGNAVDDLPVAATITNEAHPDCHIYTEAYVDVEYSYKHPGEIILFVKVTYGNVSAHDLLPWFEIHRLQGVNKFIMYPYQVSEDVMKVMRYYESLGWLIIVPFSRHNTAPFESVGQSQWYNDQEVCEYDALERLRGYKYIISFDIDEYIISRKGESWPTLFDRLSNNSRDGAAFLFRAYMYVTSWGATNNASPFSVARYTMRTDITHDTPKLLVKPGLIKDVGLATHFVHAVDGYKTHWVSHEEATINHYRVCRREWLKKDSKFPCYNVSRNEDTFILDWFKRVEKRVTKLASELGITY